MAQQLDHDLDRERTRVLPRPSHLGYRYDELFLASSLNPLSLGTRRIRWYFRASCHENIAWITPTLLAFIS